MEVVKIYRVPRIVKPKKKEGEYETKDYVRRAVKIMKKDYELCILKNMN